MKHPIISSLGLALLAGASLVTPALATMSLDYSGYFDNGSLLNGIRLVDGTPFSLTATFDETLRLDPHTYDSTFKASTLSFLIDGNTYTASSPGNQFVYLENRSGGPFYTVELDNRNKGFQSRFNEVTSAFDASNPTATSFSSFLKTYSSSPFHIDLVEAVNGLVINGIKGTPTASLSMSAVPEVTSSFTMLGLLSSGLLLRRRTKTLR
ncbi:MAG: hypothetical protein WCK77_24880 [Verrucomicrobiota bacterium]